VPPQETRRSQNIDQLLQQLQDLRSKKAELDKQEKELLATLKDKLKEQKQRLDKLGVRLEESPVSPRIEIPRLNGQPAFDQTRPAGAGEDKKK
jgi:exonuclease VII large subunit